MKTPSKFRPVQKSLLDVWIVPLRLSLVLLFLLAIGCRTSLEGIAQREIEKRPVSKVYLSGLKFFGNSMSEGRVPGLIAGHKVAYEPSEDLMTEEEMKEVKYPFKMTVKLKEKDNPQVLYSYTLLKENTTADWTIVEAWRGQIMIQNKVDLLQKNPGKPQ